MSSEIFKMMGLGNLDIAYLFIIMIIFIIILFVTVLVQNNKVVKLNKKYEKFMLGSDAKSLEDSIQELFADNKFLKENTQTNRINIKNIQSNQVYNFQKLGIVKYDAFKGIGGKLSFSLALLNDNDGGFIFNSVHSSEGCYCYTKLIEDGKSKIDLSEEEQSALNKAKDFKGTIRK